MSTGDGVGKRGVVIVVDDEAQIRRFLRISLSSQGYDVVEAATGHEGLARIATAGPDVVVLDLGLPDMDGKTVLAELRQWSAVPVMVLSVRDRESEKVAVLDSGANDYVTKPFGIQEFLARLRNLLRQQRVPEDEPVLCVGDLRIDFVQRAVERTGRSVHLTPKEYAVLRFLARHPNRIVTQTQLLREIWGPVHEHDTQYLRVIIARLRQKLGDSGDEPNLLETEFGIGYRLRLQKA